MKRERHGVFETNSSSSHSISIDENTIMLDTYLIPDEEGNLYIAGESFGWEWAKYNDARTKAQYCFADSYGNESRMDMLKEVLMEQTQAKEIVLPTEAEDNWSVPGGASVDHESSGTSGEAFASKETLRNFIFNMNSVLFTGNDNSSAPINFYVADPVKMKFKLVAEGYEQMPVYSNKIMDEDWEGNIDSNLSGYLGHIVDEKLGSLGVSGSDTWSYDKQMTPAEDMKSINIKCELSEFYKRNKNSNTPKKDVEFEIKVDIIEQ